MLRTPLRLSVQRLLLLSEPWLLSLYRPFFGPQIKRDRERQHAYFVKIAIFGGLQILFPFFGVDELLARRRRENFGLWEAQNTHFIDKLHPPWPKYH